MPTPELSLEPDKQKINDDALPFLFQIVRAGNKAFYTAYGLVDIIGDVNEADRDFYALDRTLLRTLRAFINRPAITLDNTSELLEQAKKFEVTLADELERIRTLKRPLWFFQRTKRQYMQQWEKLLKVQRTALYRQFRLLDQANNVQFTGQPLAVEILPVKTVVKELHNKPLEIPRALLSYLPIHKQRWLETEKSTQMMDFILAKHRLLTPLRLAFTHPHLDREQLDKRYKELRQEIADTGVAIKNTGFFAFWLRAFLRRWQQVLKLALHELDKGKQTWRERLTMRQQFQLEQFKTDLEQLNQVLLTGELIEGSRGETNASTQPHQEGEAANAVKADETVKVSHGVGIDLIDDASAKYLQQLQLQLQQHEMSLTAKEQALTAYERQSYELDSAYLDALRTMMTNCRGVINQRQVKIRDRLNLQAKKDRLGRLPSELDYQEPKLTLQNFAEHPYVLALKRYEQQWNLEQRHIDNATPLTEQGFSHKASLAQWQQVLISEHQAFTQSRLNLVWLLAEKIYAGEQLENAQQQTLLGLITLIEAAALPGELSVLQMDNLHALKQHLQTPPRDEVQQASETIDWAAELHKTLAKEFDVAQQLLVPLASGEHVLDVNTTQWLCAFYRKVQPSTSAHQSTYPSRLFNANVSHNDLLPRLQTLQAALAPVLNVAEKICQQRLQVSGASPGRQGSLHKDSKDRNASKMSQTHHSLSVEAKHLEEVLSFGLLLQLGDDKLKARQHQRLQQYLHQQLRIIAHAPKLAVIDAAELNAFETLMLTLDSKSAAKVQKLMAYRQTDNGEGYQATCRQWLALITQPPVASLAGLSVLSPQQAVNPNQDKASPSAPTAKANSPENAGTQSNPSFNLDAPPVTHTQTAIKIPRRIIIEPTT